MNLAPKHWKLSIRYGKRLTSYLRIGALCLLLFNLVPKVHTQTVSEETLKKINFDQKLGTQISLDLQFRDESGKLVSLADYFGKKPVILVLGYYGCPMLCTFVLNGMVGSLQDIKWDIGRQFEVINISIDPQETSVLAAAKKKTYLRRYGRKDADQGWHFLTGEESAIQQLASEVGFRYVYDAKIKQYAHPSGLVILSPQGQVSHYLSGVVYSPKELNAALVDASANKVGSPIQQLFLLCFHYSPITGKYGSLIIHGVRAAGILTLLSLGLLIVVSMRRDTARSRASIVKEVNTG